MATQHEIEQWLQEGIISAKAGQREQARFRLLDVVEQNQTNETAWFWLYQLFDTYEDKRICLENLITINPYNEWAKQELLNYLDPSLSLEAGARADPAAGRYPELADLSSAEKRQKKGLSSGSVYPVTLKLMVAFWVGISTTLLGGGVIAFGEWLTGNLRARTFPNYVTIFEAFELLVAIIFLVAGLLCLGVAVLLFFRSVIGFYGSIFLGLGLLLVGPIVSLIAVPPNYVTLVCSGGIAGMIVLLTLASQSSFEDTW